jgi:hypothetical protein
LLLNAYVYHNGDWNQILSDSKVKALKRPPEHLKRHVEYKRKEKNKQLSDSRGEHLRDDIINVIERETGVLIIQLRLLIRLTLPNHFRVMRKKLHKVQQLHHHWNLYTK